MKLAYNVKDKPSFGKIIVFALQQLLAIMAATIAVPMIVNGNVPGLQLSVSAALVGAGVGTIVYLLFTRFKSPVFLGSSFAFLGSMTAAFTGATTMALGYLGLIIGALFAGLVYVVIALVSKAVGTKWIDKLMPAVIIGPTVAIIGLSLAGNAVGDLKTANAGGSSYVAIICGLVALAVTMIVSVYGKKFMKLIPFICGICAGYAVALVFTIIGNAAGVDALKVIDFSSFNKLVEGGVKFSTFFAVPEFTFITAFGSFGELSGAYVGTIAVAYIPVAFVVFAEHLADHKNLSTIINSDLTKDPGLDKTLLGDGIGSFAGALFGGAPNTTYGESIGCVAITGNASTVTILATAFIAILIAFVNPFVAFLGSIPKCVMGGVCIALYGFIAVSGLKMIQKVNLERNANLFVVSVILILGVGGFSVSFGKVTITTVACAIILGILTNVMLQKGRKKEEAEEAQAQEAEVKEEVSSDSSNE